MRWASEIEAFTLVLKELCDFNSAGDLETGAPGRRHGQETLYASLAI